VDASNGITHAVVTSAIPSSGDELKAVTDKLSGMTGGTVVVPVPRR